MADDMDIEVTGRVNFEGSNSINKVSKDVEQLADGVTQVESAFKEVKSLLNDPKMRAKIDINEAVKNLSLLESKVSDIQRKATVELGFTINNEELKKVEEVIKKRTSHPGLMNKASSALADANQRKAFGEATGLYGGKGFIMQNNNDLGNRQYAATMMRLENQAARASHSTSRSKPTRKSLTDFYNFDSGIDINYASKELNSAEEFFFEERLKMSIQKYKKGLQDILNKDKRQTSKVLLLEDLSHRDGNWYTGERNFTTDFNTPVNEYGKAEFEKSSEEARARIQAAQEEEARIQEQKLEEQKKVLNNFMQQDPGRNVLLIGATEEAIAKAKEEELKAAEESVKAEKKSAKSSEMTAFQKEKVEAKAAEVAAYDKRTDKIAEENERKQQRWEAQAGTRAFRNAHPELFVAGGQNWNPRYQTARAFSSVGTAVGQLGPGGKVVSTVLDSIGAFVKATPAGIAVTISNLAKATLEFGKAAVQAYSEIESIKTQLGVVFSNSTQAEDMFGQISKYAVKSPFGVQQTSELAVLLKQSGVYATDLMDTLKMLGDTAGGNMEKMKRIANNYAQIVSIGKASMLDMRQFAYAGIPIFEAVSKELGVSQQELRKLISDGKVTSDIIEKVFKDLTGINGIFNEATSKGAKTLKARLQNLSDARQLALSSVGEMIVQGGSSFGNDSLITRFVTLSENFYSWMQEHADVKNIERDVGLIKNNNSRIDALQKMMQVAKDTGDKDLQRLIEEEIKYQRNLWDVDKRRSVYSESYDIKNAAYNRYKEQYGELSKEDINKHILKRRKELSSIESKIEQANTQMLYGNENPYTEEQWSDLLVQESLYKQIIEDLKNYKKALEDVAKTTEEEAKANRERNLINTQQLAYDENQKAAGREGSYSSAFEKLYSIWTQSDEYKQKKQEEEIAFLKEAKESLEELKDFVDKNGNFDMTKLSYEKFSSLYNDKAAFDINRKLNIVEGKSEQQMTEDRKILMSQWVDMTQKITDELKKDNRENGFMLATRSESLSVAKTNQEFFDKFGIVLTAQLEYLEELKKAARTDEVRNYYENMRKNLLGSTFLLGLNTEGVNADPESEAKKATQEFIPLWKRILSSATGLTTNGMTGTIQTMTNYRDDMAVRRMASDVLSATMKTMGVDTAMSLMRTNNAVQLAGDSGKTFQIDWLETRKAIKSFATQLSASTEVVTAYKNSLQAELDVYEQLVAAGYTEAESTDLGSQKFVSSKQLAKLSLGNQSQLVNAFGEVLETASGKRYNIADVRFEDGQMFDKFGNEINEEVKITGNLFEFIKGELPRIREEIHEANVAELNNSVMNKLLANVQDLYLFNGYTKSGTNKDVSKFLQGNPEYISDFVNSFLTSNKASSSTLSGLSNSDIITNAMRYDSERAERIEYAKFLRSQGRDKEAEEYEKETRVLAVSSSELAIAFLQLEGVIETLLSDESYQELQRKNLTKERDEALTADWLKMTNAANITSLSPTAWPVQGGYSWFNKFVKDLTGVDSQYTMEDLYNRGVSTGGKMKRYGLFGKEVEWNAGGDMVTLDGNQWFGENLIEETLNWNKALQDTLDTMKSLGDETASLVGQIGQKAFLAPWEKMGEQIINGKLWTEQTADAMADLGAEALNALGPIMAKAGFELVARGALDDNWAMIGGGLALAAAGGFASGLGGALSEAQSDTKDDKEADRLQSLKDQLADLLDQARRDALYYENNLRHKTALGINKEFDYQSVNDAIITPQGSVITTDPKDYLIATKTPGQFGGGNVTVTPIINCNVVNNTNAKVTQQQVQNPDGSIDILTIIEDKMGEYIASSKSDEAFGARAYRLQGKQSVMS